jgi:two-component system alkaline phosphatase synthesis response regulator PhoP
LLPHLREKDIPVIFVSAKADVVSRVQGLRLGAEDYLVKPFDILELLVRMEKVLDRRLPGGDILQHGDVILNASSHSVKKGQEDIVLKPMEFELLRTFLRYPGMVLTREQLLQQVWGEDFLGETRTIDVHVAVLRRKLDWQDTITTVFKVGYRLENLP